MTADEYRAALQALGLNVSTGADFLDIGVRTSRRYANGQQAVSRPIALLLRVLIAKKVSPATALRIAGIEHMKSGDQDEN